ncbi:insulinase family protein [Myxococcota bacterium]|nr:insulinase family protein [Myxococcota bacterium]
MASSRTRSFASAIITLWVSTLGAHALDDPAERTRVTRLDNGLTLLTLEDPASPVVSFQIWVRVGSRDESRITGLAHLFEHMMFKGSAHIEPEEHAQLVQSRGGRLNAYTNRDVTVYFEDITAETLPLVIDLEAERFANLDVSERTLTSEREVVLEERRLRTEDQPGGRGIEALMALTFQAHPYRWPVIGWRSDIENTSVDDCREFFARYYVPNNLVISIAGGFDEDLAIERIRQRFGALKRVAPVPRNPTTEPPQDGERRAQVHFDVQGARLYAAWHAPPTGHPDSDALDVLSVILSGGRSSRLYRSLVYESQRARFAHGSYWNLKDAGVFYAVAGARPGGSIDELEALFMGEIARLRVELVSEAELEKAKRQIEVSMIQGLRTSHALASRIASETVMLGKIRPLDERLESLRAVGSEDVRRVAARYLQDEKRSVVHVVKAPQGEEE